MLLIIQLAGIPFIQLSWRISRLSLLLFIFIAGNILPEGFPENTKVHTSSGIKLIQDVRVGDTVINFNKKTQQYTHGEVVNIQKKPTKSLMRLKIGDETIQVHRRQKFLNADTREWCDARDITPRQKLVAQDGNPLIVDEVYKEKECGDVHTLTIKKHSAPYTYCVGDRKTVAHNAAFVLPAVPAVGAVVAEVGTGIAVAGTAVAETVTIGATAIANTGIVTAIHTAASASAAAVYSAASGVAGWAAGLFGNTAAGTTATGMTAAGKAGLLNLAKAKVGLTLTPAMQAAAQQAFVTQGAVVVNTVTIAVSTAASALTTAASVAAPITSAATTSVAVGAAATVPVTVAATTAAVTTTAVTTAAAVAVPVATKTTAAIAAKTVVAKAAIAAKAATIAKGAVVVGGAKTAIVGTKGAIVAAANTSPRIRRAAQRVIDWWRGGSSDSGKAAMLGAAGRPGAADLISFAKKGGRPYIPPIPRPPNCPPGSPGGSPDPKEWIKKGLEWLFKDKNKVKHIFPDNDKHGFNQFIGKLGSKEAVVFKILEEIAKHSDVPSIGVFKDIMINIEGQVVQVTGVVMDGMIKLGSAWIP